MFALVLNVPRTKFLWVVKDCFGHLLSAIRRATSSSISLANELPTLQSAARGDRLLWRASRLYRLQSLGQARCTKTIVMELMEKDLKALR
jgi:hypothetical protein